MRSNASHAGGPVRLLLEKFQPQLSHRIFWGLGKWGSIKNRRNRTVFGFLVWVGVGGVEIKVDPHLVPLCDDAGGEGTRYEVRNLTLRLSPGKRPLEVPVKEYA